MTTLVITVECLADNADDADSDARWLRDKLMPMVEECVAEQAPRLDGGTEVSWDITTDD